MAKRGQCFDTAKAIFDFAAVSQSASGAQAAGVCTSTTI
jgi:hypothetical protein